MVKGMVRGGRGLVVLGGVLGIIVVALVILLQGASSNKVAADTGAGDTATPFSTVTPIPSGTPAPLVSVAAQNIPAHTKIADLGTLVTYFRDYKVLRASAIPSNAVPGLEAMVSNDLFGLTLLGVIETTTPITKGTLLLRNEYRILPFSPPGSLSYAINPGRVAEAVSVTEPFADQGAIIRGDLVNVLLTIHQKALDSLTSNPPNDTTGPVETQQLISGARVLETIPISNIYVLEMPLQDALLMKYVKDSQDNVVDLTLLSAQDVREQAPQPHTLAVVPEYFLTPLPAAPGTTPLATPPAGVRNVFAPSPPTFTPVVAPATPPISVEIVNPFRNPRTPVPTIVIINPVINP